MQCRKLAPVCRTLKCQKGKTSSTRTILQFNNWFKKWSNNNQRLFGKGQLLQKCNLNSKVCLNDVLTLTATAGTVN